VVGRWIGFTAAAIALAGLAPALATGQDSPSEQAKLPSAELTVHLTGSVGWPNTSPLYVRLAALGPPPEKPVVFADSSGLNQATATPISKGRCSKKPLRHTGLGTDEWCLDIEGLGPGSDSSATISTKQMVLKLTVGVRNNFWFLPFIVTLAGFAAGLLLAWLTTDWIPRFVKGKRIDACVKENRGREESEKVKCLESWVREQRRSTSNETLLPPVEALLSNGPSQARAARERLKAALEKSPLLQDNPIRKGAKNEADRTDHTITDFYSDGKKRDHHPADEQIVILSKANGIQHGLTRAEATIGALPSGQQSGLQPLLDDANRAFTEAADETGLTFVQTLLTELWRKIYDHIADLPMDERATYMESAIVASAAPVVLEQPSYSSPLPHLELGRLPVLLEAGLATLLSIIILAAIATAVVASSVYLPKATFGTLENYLALGVAGFTSTTAAGILAVFLLWQKRIRA
jgi:hypothetical protein